MRKILFLLCAVARLTFAQGGSPMLTVDAGTPGYGHWESSLATVFSQVPNERPLDLNYGWYDNIQLTLQTSATL